MSSPKTSTDDYRPPVSEEFATEPAQLVRHDDTRFTELLANVNHESMAESCNATHGFLNFILMLGVAGPEGADYVDNLDLFHTMEAYFTWCPKEQAA